MAQQNGQCIVLCETLVLPEPGELVRNQTLPLWVSSIKDRGVRVHTPELVRISQSADWETGNVAFICSGLRGLYDLSGGLDELYSTICNAPVNGCWRGLLAHRSLGQLNPRSC